MKSTNCADPAGLLAAEVTEIAWHGAKKMRER